jgi:ABC-type sugar transport system permease subunit
MKFSSAQGNIGSASSVAVLIFIMTSICSIGIFYFLRDRNSVN